MAMKSGTEPYEDGGDDNSFIRRLRVILYSVSFISGGLFLYSILSLITGIK